MEFSACLCERIRFNPKDFASTVWNLHVSRCHGTVRSVVATDGFAIHEMMACKTVTRFRIVAHPCKRGWSLRTPKQ